jgi:hypothetical protein
MKSLAIIRRRTPCALAASALLLAGCAAPNIGGLPTDAAGAISTFVSNAQDAERASKALGWGSTVTPGKLAAKPAPLAEFKTALCDPPFFDAAMAAKAFQSFNEEVTDLAKAPDASLGSYLRAINEHHKQLREIGENVKRPADSAELRAKLVQKCSPLIDRDLALAGDIEPSSSPTAIVGLILSLAKFATSLAALAESHARAELIQAYVVAHEAEVRQALDILATPSGLKAVVQATRTYYVRRAYAGYSDLADLRASAGRAAAPALSAADEYAQFVSKYLKMQNVDAAKLMVDPDVGLKPAFEKFIDQIKRPNSDPYAALDAFLGFLKTVTDINANHTDFLKALKDMQEGSTP